MAMTLAEMDERLKGRVHAPFVEEEIKKFYDSALINYFLLHTFAPDDHQKIELDMFISTALLKLLETQEGRRSLGLKPRTRGSEVPIDIFFMRPKVADVMLRLRENQITDAAAFKELISATATLQNYGERTLKKVFSNLKRHYEFVVLNMQILAERSERPLTREAAHALIRIAYHLPPSDKQ